MAHCLLYCLPKIETGVLCSEHVLEITLSYNYNKFELIICNISRDTAYKIVYMQKLISGGSLLNQVDFKI